jgi:hypothetical protein
MRAGFAFGTMSTSALRVNTTGFVHRPFACSRLGSVVFADAKTSAGAPCWICAASVFEPPNEYVGADAICGKTFVSDAAANTTRLASDAASISSAPSRSST